MSIKKEIEGFHFDSRKHVVQYDDVMNVHREKIYTRRRLLLGSEQIGDDVKSMVFKLSNQIVDFHQITNSNFDAKEIFEVVSAIHFDGKLQESDFENITNAKELADFTNKYLHDSFEEKTSHLPQEEVEKIAKQVILRSIDELWLEHIDSMTHLRDRVALAGYAQKDPVMEYKREAFIMFKSLLANVRHTSIQNLFRVDFEANIHFEAADYSDAITNNDEISATLENTGEFEVGQKKSEHFESDNPGRSIVAEKLGAKYANVGRNDECPCGSGKKFKKCHGKNV